MRRAWIVALLLLLLADSSFSARVASRWQQVIFSQSFARDLGFNETLMLYGNSFGVFASTDQKRFKRARLIVPGRPESIAVGIASGVSQLYAVTDLGYLLRSQDHGQSFQMIGEFPSARVTSMALTTNGQLYVGSTQGVLITEDTIASRPNKAERTYLMPWETLVLGLPIWRKASLDTENELISDWHMILEGSVRKIEVNPLDPAHIIVDIDQKGAFQSRDDGCTWEPVFADGTRVGGPIAFGRDGRIMIGLFLSTDHGKTWAKTGLRPDANDPDQRNDREFAVHSVAITPSALWALNFRSAAIYRSADGAVWELVGRRKDFFARDRETSPAILEVDPLGNLWVATNKHGLFKFVEAQSVEK